MVKTKPFVVVISGPSGTGKTTIIKELIERDSNLRYSISMTTRQKRENEIDGEHYYFVSEDEFKKRIKQGKYAEWALVYGDYYGTPKDFIEKTFFEGQNVVLDLDIKGGGKLMEVYPNGVFIFVLPPSMNVLRNRLLERKTDNPDAIEKRLQFVAEEISAISAYSYLVINKDVTTTVDQIEKILKAEETKVNRKKDLNGWMKEWKCN